MPRPLRDSTFLVSGGGRGVTASCVTALARAHGGKFVLLGRTAIDRAVPRFDYAGDADLKGQIANHLRGQGEKPAPARIEQLFKAVTGRDEIERTLQSVSEAGGEAEYIAVDITDTDAVRAALSRSSIGIVTGIIHGAGALSDKLIENKSAQDFDLVYDAKILGLRSMLACVDPERLEHLVLFSSISGFYGNRGQADYAIANEVLNKFAHAFKRDHPGCRTLTFNWGPWDGGMVTPQIRSLMEQNGVTVMSRSAGARIFVETLESAKNDVQILVNASPPPAPEIQSRPGSTRRVTRRLDLGKNPFLRDHMIGGKAVLPAACASLWMANACQQLHPGYRFFRLSDFSVLKGVVFDEGLAPCFALEVEEIESAEHERSLAVTISSSAAGDRPRYHYRGEVLLSRTIPGRPAGVPGDLAGKAAFAALRPYADGILFHGPVFQAITKVIDITGSRITVECRHAEPDRKVMGQFPADAFSFVGLDILFQAVGLWVHVHDQAAALPAGYDSFESYAPFQGDGVFYVTADIQTKSPHKVLAFVRVHDADGNVYAQATGVNLTVSRHLNRKMATGSAMLEAG